MSWFLMAFLQGHQVLGSLVKIDLNTFTLSCFGNETAGVFTNAGQDNFGGIMYGADASIYGVNVYTKKYYKINGSNGMLTELNTIPASDATIRTDMASCVTDVSLLPLCFERPLVTSTGDCKAALSWA